MDAINLSDEVDEELFAELKPTVHGTLDCEKRSIQTFSAALHFMGGMQSGVTVSYIP